MAFVCLAAAIHLGAATTTQALPLYRQEVLPGLAGFDVGNQSVPALADVDGDGDLDAVVGGNTGTLSYFCNIGTSSAPAYAAELGARNPFAGLDVGAYSAPALADVDGDGDLDAVVGESFGALKYFRNAGSSSAPTYAEETGAANPFTGIDVGSGSRPFLADVDGDGDLDAVVGEAGYGEMHYLRNTGTSVAPAFVEMVGPGINPLHGFWVGGACGPALADVDDDGDLDAVVGGDSGTLSYFRNAGSSSAPAYVEETGVGNPFLGFDVVNRSAPALADLDGDGDLDAAIGEWDGNLNYLRNTGSASTPVYLEEAGAGNPFCQRDVGTWGAPAMRDVDGDGDLDAVVGQVGDAYLIGPLSYFRNTGSSSAPAYEEVTGTDNPFDGFPVMGRPALADLDGDGDPDAAVGGGDPLRYFRNAGSSTAPVYVDEGWGSGNPFPSVGSSIGTYSAPVLADVDGDGDLDAVVGNGDGVLLYLRNIGSTSAPAYEQESGTGNPFDGFDVGFLSTPALADVDRDGDLDAVVGELYGTLRYFRNAGSSSVPVYVEEAGAGNPFADFDVGGASAPALADVDADGDVDAVVGEDQGGMFFLRSHLVVFADGFEGAGIAAWSSSEP